MPVARFEMPDGRIGRFEVPEGTTPEQAQQMISSYVSTQQPAQAAPAPQQAPAAPQAAPQPERSLSDRAGDLWDMSTRALKTSFIDPALNLQAGVVRGSGSIGATILLPADMINQKLRGEDFWSLKDNMERRAAIDGGLQAMGAEPDSWMYRGGKLVGEVAGTAGAGSVLAVGAKAAGASPAIISGLQSGGLNVAGRTGLGGLLTRAVTGSATGALAAGMVNPEDADVGAVVGGALPVLAKGGAAVGKAANSGVKSLVEPLYRRGKEKIVGRALREFAGDQVDDAIRNLQQSRELVPGSLPTVGEASGVPSLAALQRASVNVSPEAANAMEARAVANNQARVDVLELLSGSKGAREAAESARSDAAAAAYGAARAQAPEVIAPSKELLELAERPTMKRIIAGAKRLAADKGEKIGNPLESIDGLHYIKLSVDDALSGTANSALARNQKAAVMDIKDRLIAEMDKVSPAYGEARRAFAEASKPINQMDIVEELKGSIAPLTGKLRAAQYASKLSDDTAARATGFKGATLKNTLTPEQLAQLTAIRDDLARADFAANAGRAAGTNTVQNLSYGNMLNQFGVPNFLRNMPAGQVVGGLLGRGADAIYGKANKEIAGLLAETMLSPQEAARLMMIRDGANPALIEAARKGLLGTSKAAPVLVSD